MGRIKFLRNSFQAGFGLALYTCYLEVVLPETETGIIITNFWKWYFVTKIVNVMTYYEKKCSSDLVPLRLFKNQEYVG